MYGAAMTTPKISTTLMYTIRFSTGLVARKLSGCPWARSTSTTGRAISSSRYFAGQMHARHATTSAAMLRSRQPRSSSMCSPIVIRVVSTSASLYSRRSAMPR